MTVYVEQFSAHPLESDASELYAPPDGYLGADGVLPLNRASVDDRPVYEVTLNPEDGLYLLPYMARQADGSAWEDDRAHPVAPEIRPASPFSPTLSALRGDRPLRTGRGGPGQPALAQADYDFYRVAPSGGYKKGLRAAMRTDSARATSRPEANGHGLLQLQARRTCAATPRTRFVARHEYGAVGDGSRPVRRAGSGWRAARTSKRPYWLNLLIDTEVPICGNSSQRPHGA